MKGKRDKQGVKALLTLAFLWLALVTTVSAAFAQGAGGGGANGGQPSGGNNDPGSAFTSRQNYFLRFPVAKQAYDLDKVDKNGKSPDGQPVSHTNPGDPVYMWPAMVPTAQSTPPTARDGVIGKNLFKTFGYPVSDSQFQIIERYNHNRMLEQMFDPERAMWTTQTAAGMGANNAANSIGASGVNQVLQAIDYCSMYLNNFTAEPGNVWQTIRDQLFIPMAVLLLLPGAVLAQVRAIVAQGSPVLIGQEVHPLEGILRSIVCIFLIPGSFLVINYGIDVANSITFTIASEYTRQFGSNMYSDAKCAILRAVPVEQAKNRRNAITTQEQPTSQGQTVWAVFEGLTLITELRDPCAGVDNVQTKDEDVTYTKSLTRLFFNSVVNALGMTWDLACTFQMVYLYYLWCMGPIAAALWVWPVAGLRAALGSWCEGVITVCFWSLFWNTVILLMACFRGVGDSGTIVQSALIMLAISSVQSAFDFGGLASQLVQNAMMFASQAANAMGGGSGGGNAAGGNTAKAAGAGAPHGAGNTHSGGHQPAHAGADTAGANSGTGSPTGSTGAGPDGKAISPSGSAAAGSAGSALSTGGAAGDKAGAAGGAAGDKAGGAGDTAGGASGAGHGHTPPPAAAPAGGGKGGGGAEGGGADGGHTPPPGGGGSSPVTANVGLHVQGGNASLTNVNAGGPPGSGAGGLGGGHVGPDGKPIDPSGGGKLDPKTGLPLDHNTDTPTTGSSPSGALSAGRGDGGLPTTSPTGGSAPPSSLASNLAHPETAGGLHPLHSPIDNSQAKPFLSADGHHLDTSKVGPLPAVNPANAGDPNFHRAQTSTQDIMAGGGVSNDKLNLALQHPGGKDYCDVRNATGVAPELLKAGLEGNSAAATVAQAGFGETPMASKLASMDPTHSGTAAQSVQMAQSLDPGVAARAAINMDNASAGQMLNQGAAQSFASAADHYRSADGNGGSMSASDPRVANYSTPLSTGGQTMPAAQSDFNWAQSCSTGSVVGAMPSGPGSQGVMAALEHPGTPSGAVAGPNPSASLGMAVPGGPSGPNDLGRGAIDPGSGYSGGAPAAPSGGFTGGAPAVADGGFSGGQHPGHALGMSTPSQGAPADYGRVAGDSGPGFTGGAPAAPSGNFTGGAPAAPDGGFTGSLNAGHSLGMAGPGPSGPADLGRGAVDPGSGFTGGAPAAPTSFSQNFDQSFGGGTVANHFGGAPQPAPQSGPDFTLNSHNNFAQAAPSPDYNFNNFGSTGSLGGGSASVPGHSLGMSSPTAGPSGGPSGAPMDLGRSADAGVTPGGSFTASGYQAPDVSHNYQAPDISHNYQGGYTAGDTNWSNSVLASNNAGSGPAPAAPIHQNVDNSSSAANLFTGAAPAAPTNYGSTPVAPSGYSPSGPAPSGYTPAPSAPSVDGPTLMASNFTGAAAPMHQPSLGQSAPAPSGGAPAPASWTPAPDSGSANWSPAAPAAQATGTTWTPAPDQSGWSGGNSLAAPAAPANAAAYTPAQAPDYSQQVWQSNAPAAVPAPPSPDYNYTQLASAAPAPATPAPYVDQSGWGGSNSATVYPTSSPAPAPAPSGEAPYNPTFAANDADPGARFSNVPIEPPAGAPAPAPAQSYVADQGWTPGPAESGAPAAQAHAPQHYDNSGSYYVASNDAPSAPAPVPTNYGQSAPPAPNTIRRVMEGASGVGGAGAIGAWGANRMANNRGPAPQQAKPAAPPHTEVASNAPPPQRSAAFGPAANSRRQSGKSAAQIAAEEAEALRLAKLNMPSSGEENA